MAWSAKWGYLKWGQGRWGFPGKSGTNFTGSFEADGAATVAVSTHQGFTGRFEADGKSASSYKATLVMRGQAVAQGVCSVAWATHQTFLGMFQVDKRDEHWKRYLNGLGIDAFTKDGDGGQQFWHDGLSTDFITHIPEVVFFTGFKGKEFKYYYDGLQVDGLNQDGSQTFWKDGLAYDFLDTPVTNEATIIFNGEATMDTATRQTFAARLNWLASASVQFGSTMTQVGRLTANGKGSLTINKTNSAMLANFVANGLATVTFISGVGSVKITCVDTGSIGGGQPSPSISFLYDAPYSY